MADVPATTSPANETQSTKASDPPSLITTDNVQIKVVSFAPPRPDAAGVPVTPPAGSHRLPYDFKGQSSPTVVMPVILSTPPPHKRLLSHDDSSSDEVDLGEQRLVRVRFEVTVDGVRERESVRLTGNASSLGRWNVLNSVPLQRSTKSSDVWYVELEVPAERPIKYRYLITRPASCQSDGGFTIVSWETFTEPRVMTVKKPRVSEETNLATRTVQYGVIEDGVSVIDGGWLVRTSELHLQLGTLGPSVSISSHPDHTHYLIKAHTFSTQPNKELDCSPFKAKLLSRTNGDCVTFDLSTDGCPYDQTTNMLVFTTESPDFQHIGVLFDVYTCEPSTMSGPSSSCKVGRASLLPRQYVGDTSRGNVVLTVFSEDLVPVGTLSLSFLLVHPTGGLVHSAKHSNCWKRHERMLHIGHRGLGDSYHTELKPTVTENTISSLKIAGNHGADYVEFDVQLTKDHVPIVYHNFMVCTTLAREGFFSGELYEMQVKDLTLHQLQSLKLDHSSVLQKSLGASLHYSSSSASDVDSSSEQWGGRRGAAYRESLPERKTFPTLKKLFQSLPKDLGFNIEVKYPLPERDKEGKVIKDYSSCDINLMADSILKVVHRHAKRRKVLFSCFNPDMCTVLCRKQQRYPVFFLTCGLNPHYGVSLDVRGRSVHEAVMHAKAHDLQGIVTNSLPILDDPSLVRAVKDKNLILFSWGQENNDLHNIETQSKAGVDAVIYDCIHRVLEQQKANKQQQERLSQDS